MRPCFKTLAVAIWLLLLLESGAAAATLRPSLDRGLCTLELSGPVEEGDLTRLESLSSTVFPREIGESTVANTVCLDSPGGSFVEGVRLATYFYENGIGTVVAKDKECFSACSIIFMMGRAAGPEVSFINRRLHIGGHLGFHRPSLNLEDGGAFGAREMEASYDLAVSSVVQFLLLANRTAPWSTDPMVRSDLVERMFATRGDDIYLIDTVEKAARWDIDLVGVEYPPSIDEARAYYACENTLQWRVGLFEEKPNFVAVSIGGFTGAPYAQRTAGYEGEVLFDVTSRKAGYGAAGCLIKYNDGNLSMCAIDEYTGTEIGRGPCRIGENFELWSVNPLALWRPDTQISELDEPWSSEIIQGTCFVLSGEKIIDEATCSALVSADYPVGGTAGQTFDFQWPSGSKTVVRVGGNSVYEINGAPANREYVEGYAACYQNSKSLNRFCFALSQ